MEDLKFQEDLIKILHQGWVEIPGRGWIYSYSYFKVLYTLSKMLSVNLLAEWFRKSVSSYYGVPAITVSLPKRDRCFERLQVGERRGILRLAKRLLENWPEGFISFWAWRGHLPRHYYNFSGDGTSDDIPFWFWSVLRDYVIKPTYRESHEEREAKTEYIYRKASEGEDLEKLSEMLYPFDMREFIRQRRSY
jgi:hypothetical protein